MIKCRDRKENEAGYGKRGAYRRKSYGFEYRTPGSVFFYPLLLHLFILHFQSLLLSEFLKIKLISMNLRTDSIPAHFLNHSNIHLHTIPEDCKEGLKELDTLLGKRLNWNQDILPNWGLRRAA